MSKNKVIQKTVANWDKLKFDLPILIGNEYVNFSKQAFIRSGFINGYFERWKPRKDKKKRGKGRKTLVLTGRLKRSIRLLRCGYLYAIVGTDVPYAQIHNEGGVINKTVTVRQHKRKGVHYSNSYSIATRRKLKRRNKNVAEEVVKQHQRKMNTTIPQRQFIGESAFFNKRAIYIITRELKSCFSQK